MKRAVKLPITKCNLEVRVGLDGAWLRFKTSSGKEAVINVPSLDNGGIIGAAINQWCIDRQDQAAKKGLHTI